MIKIEYETGDLFNSAADIYVNAVNCQGVMGAGIAKVFADKFPGMYKEYKHFCKTHTFTAGMIHDTTDFLDLEGTQLIYIFNAATMDYPGSTATFDNIYDCVVNIFKLIFDKRFEYDSLSTIVINCPYLGCGIGGFSKVQFNSLCNYVVKLFNNLNFAKNKTVILRLVDYER